MKKFVNPNAEYWEENENFIAVCHCAYKFREQVRGTVVDLGCGRGEVTDALCKENPNVRSVLACDVDKQRLKEIGERGYKTKRINLDEYPLPLPTGAFDTVILADVIEHVLQPYVVLSEIHRILKKGGKLMIITPNAAFTKVTIPHLSYYSRSGLRMQLERVGFTRVEWVYNGVLSPQLTRITAHIPIVRGILSRHGLYAIVTK